MTKRGYDVFSWGGRVGEGVNIAIRNPQFMALIYRLFFAIMGAKVLYPFAGEPAITRVW
jgi:hypothetical protein